MSNQQICLEDGIPEAVREQLEAMGHSQPRILTGWDRLEFGTGQIIRRNPENGVLCAGSDPRQDGMAIGW
jgi:gamma-glutamyltranspeptidase/glutathione hydrolase